MKILIAGDFRSAGVVEDYFNRMDYESVLGQVKQITDEIDYSIVNFESPVVEHEASPIIKCGPNLSSSNSGLKALKWAGFDCITLANNHFLDFGEVGVRDTIDNSNLIGIDTVGGGLNLTEASKTIFKDIAGQRLAVINCCEHEFSIATDKTSGSNPLNPIRQFNAIKDAKANADRVLVIVHGGHEHFQLPSPRMVETYRFFVDAGADAVVNHHQHCYSGYEVYKDRPIFYGLGNFCYLSKKNRNGKWTEGYMVSIDFSSTIPSFKLHPYLQCADNIGVELLSEHAFDTKIQIINETIANPSILQNEVEKYYSTSSDSCGNLFEPFYNEFYLGAKSRGWLPSFISTKRVLMAKNIISCESHFDKLSWWFNKYFTNKS